MTEVQKISRRTKQILSNQTVDIIANTRLSTREKVDLVRQIFQSTQDASNKSLCKSCCQYCFVSLGESLCQSIPVSQYCSKRCSDSPRNGRSQISSNSSQLNSASLTKIKTNVPCTSQSCSIHPPSDHTNCFVKRDFQTGNQLFEHTSSQESTSSKSTEACLDTNIPLTSSITSSEEDARLPVSSSHQEITEGSEIFPLLAAVSLGEGELVELLMEQGVDVNESLRGRHWEEAVCPTALHQACLDGRLDLVQILISSGHTRSDEGLEFESINYRGQTPFHMAVESGNIDLVEYLADRDCNVSAYDMHGNNALHIICTSMAGGGLCGEQSSDISSRSYNSGSGSASSRSESSCSNISTTSKENGTSSAIYSESNSENCCESSEDNNSEDNSETSNADSRENSSANRLNSNSNCFKYDSCTSLDVTNESCNSTSNRSEDSKRCRNCSTDCNSNANINSFNISTDTNNLVITTDTSSSQSLSSNQTDPPHYLYQFPTESASVCCQMTSMLLQYGVSLHQRNSLGFTPVRLATLLGRHQCVRLMLAAASEEIKNLRVNGWDISTSLSRHGASSNVRDKKESQFQNQEWGELDHQEECHREQDHQNPAKIERRWEENPAALDSCHESLAKQEVNRQSYEKVEECLKEKQDKEDNKSSGLEVKSFNQSAKNQQMDSNEFQIETTAKNQRFDSPFQLEAAVVTKDYKALRELIRRPPCRLNPSAWAAPDESIHMVVLRPELSGLLRLLLGSSRVRGCLEGCSQLGYTPLYSACAGRNHRAVELLLAAGANPDGPSQRRSVRPLRLAILQADIDTCRRLLLCGARACHCLSCLKSYNCARGRIRHYDKDIGRSFSVSGKARESTSNKSFSLCDRVERKVDTIRNSSLPLADREGEAEEEVGPISNASISLANREMEAEEEVEPISKNLISLTERPIAIEVEEEADLLHLAVFTDVEISKMLISAGTCITRRVESILASDLDLYKPILAAMLEAGLTDNIKSILHIYNERYRGLFDDTGSNAHTDTYDGHTRRRTNAETETHSSTYTDTESERNSNRSKSTGSETNNTINRESLCTNSLPQRVIFDRKNSSTENDTTSTINDILTALQNPITLKQACRTRIRAELCPRVLWGVEKLPLPTIVKRYLSLDI